MKKNSFLKLALLLVFSQLFTLSVSAKILPEELRAVWISTVYNLDYPSVKNNVQQQKAEFIQILDQIQEIGLNTVVVQVRPKADALYSSQINPWSDVLTGTQGKNPGYDPLAFMIEETHKRGMSFHAWLNPYRVTTSGTDLNTLAANHPARLNPSWVLNYNNALYYNPEVEGVKQHIVDTVTEIVTNYDVDAIHFDDYFYPSNYPLPQGETKDGAVANQRREHINEMVRRVSEAIKKADSEVAFGISPMGIWKNTLSDFSGSNTNGSESYYRVFADTRTWIQNEWVDYIVPQIYWEIGHTLADYKTLVSWWSNEVKNTSVKLYIGQGIYKDEVAKEITTQLSYNKTQPEVKGSFYFSLRDLLNNRQNVKTLLTSYYKNMQTTTATTTVASGTTSVLPNSVTSVKGKTGTVTASVLNIRAGARVDRAVVTKVSAGTKVTLLDTLNNWYKVRLSNGQVGWASSQYINVL
jgi:uncharacterized lipoprotein YddW (UPF0748 family)